VQIELEGRVAVVTGAAGGIGVPSCLALAEGGARVVVVDLDSSNAELAAASLREAGHEALAVAADVSDPTGVESYVTAALDRFGRIDVLFNNAGIEGSICPFEDYPVEVFDRVLAVNTRSVFLALRSVLPLMKAAGRGSVINCSSVSGIRGSAGVSGYAASKHAVIGLTRVAAAEAAPAGVRVNAVLPGPIRTRMMESISALSLPDDPAAAARATAAKNPTGRWGEADEVARVVCFLASDAASFVNGACWSVDGGRTAI
jgi:3alpha(or 20beta)-hydroxysteroid dehydrogenase